jgi:TetR/AcrR family transcriptional regulator, lmrAB and yxaGH operons repressor
MVTPVYIKSENSIATVISILNNWQNWATTRKLLFLTWSCPNGRDILEKGAEDLANRTISETDFLDKALDLFRTYGFEGASLNRLSEATGLEKASLYYRYPGGKDEIVMAALSRAAQWFEEHVFAPLKSQGTPKDRVALVVDQLRNYFANGTMACIAEVLSISGGSEELAAALKIVMLSWMKAFIDIGRESGLSPSLARLRAEEAIVRIEGSLVVARVLGDSAPFQRCMKDLSDLLTEP